MTDAKESLFYRRDIDGLRAVAVLAVVAFHAEIAAFRGGFVGVDVFFVISGYLISGIIFNALRKGTFSFAEFYTRRINRIFPALIVVTVVVAAVGWVVLFPPEFIQLGKHTLGSSGFVSNLILWKESGYFDSRAKPMLHLWSLAVEEQFYLVWPIVLLIAWKRRWSIAVTAAMIVGVSFAWNIFAVANHSATAAFFLPFTRFWEILSGGLLCWWQLNRQGSGKAEIPVSMSNALSAFGLVLLLVAIRTVDSETLWPGWLALLPVVGTLLMIAAGEKALINRWVLGNRPMVAVGLISYPLYLWHWPMFVFAHLIIGPMLPRSVRIAIVVLAFLLAAATYLLIERPIRFGNRKRRSARLLFAGMIFVGVIGLMMYRGVVRPRLASRWDMTVGAFDPPVGPGGYFDKSGRAVGSALPGDSSVTVAVIGDSHGQMYRPRFEELAKRRANQLPRVVFYTFGGCPPWPGVDREGMAWDGGSWRCAQYHREVMQDLMGPRIGAVVIAAFWEGYFDFLPVYLADDKRRTTIVDQNGPQIDSVFRMFERELSMLNRAGKRVYIVLSNPRANANDPSEMLPRRLPGLTPRVLVTGVPRSDIEIHRGAVSDRLRKAAERTGTIVIDPLEYLCTAAYCPTVQADGRSIYADTHHIRPSFMRDSVTYLDRVLERR